MPPGYESFFGFTERPFSLTSDPKYFFRGGSHGRALESLIFGLRRQEGVLLVAGDVGVGKTVLCRALVEQQRRRGPVAFVPNPLITPSELFRLLLEDFGVAPSSDEARSLAAAEPHELHYLLEAYFSRMLPGSPATVIVDDAHRLPVVVVQHLLGLAAPEPNRERALQLVFIGHATGGEALRVGLPLIDERAGARARLAPLGRDECGAYVVHRLRVAGSGARVSFSPRAVDVLYGLSGGVPRHINLLCDRALQEASSRAACRVEPAMIAVAASSLELLRARPRRFRWFSRRETSVRLGSTLSARPHSSEGR
jgi:general secretion pathway protein A